MSIDFILDAINDIKRDKEFSIDDIKKINEYFVPVLSTEAPETLLQTFFNIISKEYKIPTTKIIQKVLEKLSENNQKIYYSSSFLNFLLNNNYPILFYELIARTSADLPIDFLKNLKNRNIILSNEAYKHIFKILVDEKEPKELEKYIKHLNMPVEVIFSVASQQGGSLNYIADEIFEMIYNEVKKTKNYEIYKKIPAWFISKNFDLFVEKTMKNEEDILNIISILFTHFRMDFDFIDNNYDILGEKLIVYFFLVKKFLGDNNFETIFSVIPNWFIKKYKEDFDILFKMIKKYG